MCQRPMYGELKITVKTRVEPDQLRAKKRRDPDDGKSTSILKTAVVSLAEQPGINYKAECTAP